MRSRNRHPANIARHDNRDRVARYEDKITNYLGSSQFLITQTVVILAWISINVAAYALRWDPYPFILLNLVFSTQAAYAAPLILMSQNRQSEHDRVTAEHDYGVNQESLELNRECVRLLREIAGTPR